MLADLMTNSEMITFFQSIPQGDNDGPSPLECFFEQFQKLRKTLSKEESCTYAENTLMEDNIFKLDWMVENKKLNLSKDLYMILKH